MKIRVLFFFVFLFGNLAVHGQQGKLLLVGGGGEVQGGWSDAPYQWAVNQSANKRVAILGWSTATSWLPNYFQSLGAVYAKNFQINSTALANSQATYDSLMTYDVIFIRGGDQYNYYSAWKNTLLTQAISLKYQQGGVIAGTSAGMAVLSGVVFTAQFGSVYPDECLETPNLSYITLAGDFLQLFPGYIFDTHFVERGRMARLAAFLAKYWITNQQLLKGIGVDDRTALGISGGMGYAFGTGAVNFYIPENASVFSWQTPASPLHLNNLKTVALINGDSWNFQTNLPTLGAGTPLPVFQNWNENRTVLLSGSDVFSENQSFLQYLVQQTGIARDSVLIVTGSSTTLANQIRNQLLSLGASVVVIRQALTSNGNDPNFAADLWMAAKILVVNNTFPQWQSFLSTYIGQALSARLQAGNGVAAFWGDNSRFAGKTIVENYLTADAAYYGNLTFHPGLALLPSTVVMPNTYLYSTTYYENTNAAVPYAMAQDTLSLGLWLNPESFAVLRKNLATDSLFLLGQGRYPMILLKSNGTAGRKSVTPSSPGGSVRQVAGWGNMSLITPPNGSPYTVGYAGPPAPTCQAPQGIYHSRVTPTTARLHWSPVNNAVAYEVSGRPVGQSTWMDILVSSSADFLNVSGLQPGVNYVWRIRALCGNETGTWSVNDTFYTSCQIPDGLSVPQVSINGALLSWQAVHGAQFYQIKGAKLGSQAFSLLLVAGNQTSKAVFGLSSATGYYWQVRAICDNTGQQLSAFSQTDTFYTNPLRQPDFSEKEGESGVPGFAVYPNPASDRVVIETEGFGPQTLLRLFGTKGNQILEKPLFEAVHQLNVEHLPEGLYLITISDGTYSATKRLLISR